uniref:Uncharacterized protein n=1 Tax=Glossina austeni TaxID=7395 RepID=A0A1A9UW83_GLOAU
MYNQRFVNFIQAVVTLKLGQYLRTILRILEILEVDRHLFHYHQKSHRILLVVLGIMEIK